MTQSERRRFLIDYLIAEDAQYAEIPLSDDEAEQKRLLRSLVNVREAKSACSEFLRVQDEYLQEESRARGIVDAQTIFASTEQANARPPLYLWRGDITTLKIGAIVNAANSGLTGCYQPCHSCIDNAIHTAAGIQLRAECAAIMQEQGHAEPAGKAKITRAYNLPCDFVIHTVGPIVHGKLTERDCVQLANCYKSCLSIAQENGVGSIAFCCISTGVFCFPAEKAAEIAVRTVREWLSETKSALKVVFNVFSENDEAIYRRILYD